MYSKSFQILIEHTLKTEIISVKMVIKGFFILIDFNLGHTDFYSCYQHNLDFGRATVGDQSCLVTVIENHSSYQTVGCKHTVMQKPSCQLHDKFLGVLMN